MIIVNSVWVSDKIFSSKTLPETPEVDFDPEAMSDIHEAVFISDPN